jgi:hypothetical protein
VPLERVQVMKQESTALGGDDADSGPGMSYPIDPFEDVIEAAGFELQEPFDETRTRDNDVMVSRSSGKMTFKDQENPTAVTLTDLIGGAGGFLTYNEFLLDNEPTAETGTTDCTYTPTYVSGQVTKEEWKRNDTTLIKSIDYTYTTGRLTQEVRKVFAANGTTITAQVTWSYSYTGQTLTSATMVRDV